MVNVDVIVILNVVAIKLVQILNVNQKEVQVQVVGEIHNVLMIFVYQHGIESIKVQLQQQVNVSNVGVIVIVQVRDIVIISVKVMSVKEKLINLEEIVLDVYHLQDVIVEVQFGHLLVQILEHIILVNVDMLLKIIQNGKKYNFLK